MQFKPEQQTLPPAALWLILTIMIYCWKAYEQKLAPEEKSH